MPLRLVVVDDDPDISLLLHTSLTLAGFEVVGEAVNGAEGIELVQRLQPDGVILDVMMPVMDGLSALPAIKEVAPATSVVMYSSVDVASIKEAAELHGARVVPKTAGPDGVVAALRAEGLSGG